MAPLQRSDGPGDAPLHDLFGPPEPFHRNRTASSGSDGRASERDAEIREKEPDAAEEAHIVFFARSSATLDADERAKVTRARAETDDQGRPQSWTLRGRASEEGDPSFNRALINRRMAAVSAVLGGSPPQVAEFAASKGSADYRFFRSVRLEPAGAQTPTSPTIPCPANVSAAFAQAIRVLTNASRIMAGRLTNDQLQIFASTFHSRRPADVQEIARNLQTMLSQLRGFAQEDATSVIKPSHHCGTQADPQCRLGLALTGELMSLCEGFYAMAAPISTVAPTVAETQAHIVLHETAHGSGVVPTPSGPQGAGDVAKSSERLFSLLTFEQARRNADSYAALIRNLDTPGSCRIGPPTPDDIQVTTGLGAPADRQAAAATEEAIGWLDEVVTVSGTEMGQLYRAMDVVREAGDWDRAKVGRNPDGVIHFQRTMELVVAAPFAVTPPPARPTEGDQRVVSALFDRFDEMPDPLRDSTNLQVRSGPATAWTPGPGQSLTVDASFPSLALRDRVRALLVALARAMPGISDSAAPRYAKLGPDLLDHRNPGLMP